MSAQGNSRNGGNRATGDTALDVRSDTETDPLRGWFRLAGNVKPSRDRRWKRSWNGERRA
jgi:hypothetical protein